MAEELINVEVAYALPDRQLIVHLQVRKGTTAYDAAVASGIAGKFRGVDLETAVMGVFGKTEKKPRERQLADGERVEIYRPLLADPKEVRKKRAAEAKAKARKGEAAS